MVKNKSTVSPTTIKYLCNSQSEQFVNDSHGQAESAICNPLLKEHPGKLVSLLQNSYKSVDEETKMRH